MRTVKKTAEQVIRELDANPEYQARVRERRERSAAIAAACAPEDTQLVAEFRAAGIKASSVYDLVNTAAPYPELYPVLVRHLALPHHPRIREGIIRALTVKDAGSDVESALFREFQSESDPLLRWVLASALKTVMPYRTRKKHPEIQRVFANTRNA